MDSRQELVEQYATLGVEELDVGAQHDVLLTSWLGVASGFRKLHDYSLCFSGAAVDLTESQVHFSISRSPNLRKQSFHCSN
jgi:hypothetical protein